MPSSLARLSAIAKGRIIGLREATSISMGARGEGGKEGERARGITQERFHDLEYNAEQPTKTELFSQNHQRTIEEQLRTTHKN